MADGTSIWVMLLSAKTPEAWMSIFGGSVYVWYKSGNASRVGKAIEAGISGILAIAIGPDLIEVTEYPATIVYFVVSVFGFLLLDIATSVVSDKAYIADIMKNLVNTWLRIDNKTDKRKDEDKP